MSVSAIALLGRKDQPTDAVEDYCRYLASALQAYQVQLQIRRVPWDTLGWRESLRALKLMSSEWRDKWVFVQYTALAWSQKGLPQKLLDVMRILKSTGARVAVVFHDVEPYPGSRAVDRVRHFGQLRIMRRSLALAEKAIFTVRPEQVSWLPLHSPKVVFIPVGANLPVPAEVPAAASSPGAPVIGVFSITGGSAGTRETELILNAVRHATQSVGRIRLSVFGRYAELREAALRDGLRALPVDLTVEGVLDPELVVQRFLACSVLLFVRGNISSRRGSAIAGIACGLPVVAFSGSETAAPISDAGIVLIPPDQPEQLNQALVRVLSSPQLRDELAARSRAVYLQHFAWPAIAHRFAEILQFE